MDNEENLKAEMARIASLSVRLKKFADMLAISFAFFVYAAGITGFILIGRELSLLLEAPASVIVGVSNIVGVVVSTTIVVYIYTFLFKYAGIKTDGRETISAVLAGLILGFVAAGIYTLALNISGFKIVNCWYPWFGGYMTGLGIYHRKGREPSSQYVLLAGLLILLTSPIAMLGHELFLIGLVDIIFTLMGFLALRGLNKHLTK